MRRRKGGVLDTENYSLPWLVRRLVSQRRIRYRLVEQQLGGLDIPGLSQVAELINDLADAIRANMPADSYLQLALQTDGVQLVRNAPGGIAALAGLPAVTYFL